MDITIKFENKKDAIAVFDRLRNKKCFTISNGQAETLIPLNKIDGDKLELVMGKSTTEYVPLRL